MRIIYNPSKKELLPGDEGQRWIENNRIYEWIRGYLSVSPPIPSNSDIINYDKPLNERKWRVPTQPAYMDAPQYNSDGAVALSSQQKEYMTKEYNRIENGIFIYIYDTITYITGEHYYELSYFPMDVGLKEYRDRDRRFWSVWRMAKLDPFCLGVIKCKPRREGATYQALSLVYREISLHKSTVGGLQGNTERTAKRNFGRINRSHRKMPWWLRPSSNSEQGRSPGKELIFPHLESKVVYAPSTAHALDGEKLRIWYFDEAGKLGSPGNINEVIEVVSETMMLGPARQGMGAIFTTVDEVGGSLQNFRILWNEAEPFYKEDDVKNTHFPSANRFIRIFMPTWDGQEGFIGPYGESIIIEPTAIQKEYLLERFKKQSSIYERGWGAKKYRDAHIASFKGNASKIAAYMRKYPSSESEIFGLANGKSEFNLAVLQQVLAKLDYHKDLARRGHFAWKNETKTEIKWVYDPEGRFWVSWLPEDLNAQAKKFGNVQTTFSTSVIRWAPSTPVYGFLGADPFKKSQSRTTGSRGGLIGVMPYQPTSELLAGQKIPSGPCWFLYYDHRPSSLQEYFEDCIMACHVYGFKINPEANLTGMQDYFNERGYQDYYYTAYELTGKYSVENAAEAGTSNTTGKVIQGKIGLIDRFIDGNDPILCPLPYDIIEEIWRIPFPPFVESLMSFTFEERTHFDDVMAAGQALEAMVAIGPSRKKNELDYRGLMQILTN